MVIILDICKNRENNYSKQIFHNKTGSRARVCVRACVRARACVNQEVKQLRKINVA